MLICGGENNIFNASGVTEFGGKVKIVIYTSRYWFLKLSFELKIYTVRL